MNDLRDWVEEKERKIDSLTTDFESLEIEHSDLIKLIIEIRDWLADLTTVEWATDLVELSVDECNTKEEQLTKKLREIGIRWIS